jgi:hypothetical protein
VAAGSAWPDGTGGTGTGMAAEGGAAFRSTLLIPVPQLPAPSLSQGAVVCEETNFPTYAALTLYGAR